ncbi:MAG: DUF6765 family protein, partial [Candidatus Cloacimonadota bacterium]|nr:DUF6765 family protein [Candidatus Cloacimonadota bacterium]
MKIDSHYYAIFALSKMVGFKDEIAKLIAYSSQFVDDNKINTIELNQ